LELVKRHIIEANQNELFGEIDLNSEKLVDENLELDIEFNE
jgi:chromatin segregation and condensation protein Rec8/ScpA/Scc1 (kleisin family)